MRNTIISNQQLKKQVHMIDKFDKNLSIENASFDDSLKLNDANEKTFSLLMAKSLSDDVRFDCSIDGIRPMTLAHT